MTRTLLICISVTSLLGSYMLCAAESNKRPLIYTDGSIGPGFKHFNPEPDNPPRYAGRSFSRSIEPNRNTLSFQTFKFLHRWGNETDILLIGGKDHVYMVSGVLDNEELEIDDIPESLTYKKILTWKAVNNKKECMSVPNRDSNLCENYIQFIELMDSELLLVCGTNAFSPDCRYYSIDNFSDDYHVDDGNSPFVRPMVCMGPCPVSPHPTAGSVSLYSETNAGYQIFTALRRNDRSLIMRDGGPILTSMDSWLKDSTFLKIIEFKEYLYLFFRETSDERESLENQEETYARVARVCKNDPGGHHSLYRRWSTFMKARLTCYKKGREQNIFNNLTSVSDIVSIPDQSGNMDNVIFATFTSPWEWRDASLSSICAYSINDIARVFDEGRFLDTYDIILPATVTSNQRYPVTVPESERRITRSYPIDSDKVPRARKCDSDHTRNPETENTAKYFYLLYDNVEPKFNQQLYVTSNFRATQITVDYNGGGERKIMLYVGSEEGKVLRIRNMIVNSDEWKTVLVESIDAANKQDCSECGIRSLHISRQGRARPSVFVAFTDRVVQMPVARCNAYKARECCSVDPDCGWLEVDGACIERHGNENRLLSPISDETFPIPESCKARGMVVTWNRDCYRSGRNKGIDDDNVADGVRVVPDYLLHQVTENAATTGSTLDGIVSSSTASLEREFRDISRVLSKGQMRAMSAQLKETVPYTIKLVLENHRQEYCLPTPAVGRLVHVYPLLLREIDLWHATALKKMTHRFEPKCWNDESACNAKASFSLPLLPVLWDPLKKLIENFSGECSEFRGANAAARKRTPAACVPLPGLGKCQDSVSKDCRRMRCKFAGYAVDPRAFFRHVNDTGYLHNSASQSDQPDPLWKSVNATGPSGGSVEGHLELMVSDAAPFLIDYSPESQKVKINFYYKPVRCSALSSEIEKLFDSAFSKMSRVRNCFAEVNHKGKRRRPHHRRRNGRSASAVENGIASLPPRCKFAATKKREMRKDVWDGLVKRGQKAGGIFLSHRQILSFDDPKSLLQFFKKDCPQNSTIARTTFTKTHKRGYQLAPLVAKETPFKIRRSGGSISMKFYYAKESH